MVNFPANAPGKMCPNKYFFLIFISFTLGVYQSLLSQNVIPEPIIDINNLREHTNHLGSDRFQGRGTGTEGETAASKYIASQLVQNGVSPIGDKDSYYQNIPMHGGFPLQSSQFILRVDKSDILLKLGTDYLLYKTGAETYISNPTPLIFVGYGIIAPEYDYNDYLNIDVEGKVVVFLSGEPNSEDEYFFQGSSPTVYSYPEAKQRIAISRGALGSIMIPMLDSSDQADWDYWIKEFAFEHVTLAYTVSSHMSILLNPERANKILSGSPYIFQDIVDMHTKGTLSSFDLETKVSFDGKFDERDFISRNVIGMVEGSDAILKDSYIILSAHYDHLGIGFPVEGDSIYNGVMDNAMGVAALIELSRVFSGLQSKPRRSIIFLFLTGEEKGLLGSKYYTDHPVKPLYKTVATINIDGLAAFDEFEDIIGVGAELSSLENDLITVSKRLNLEVSSIPKNYFYESENISRSDQYSFMTAGIPSILITEGLRYKNTTYQEGIERLIKWTKNVYHSPFDDLYQNINFDAAEQHLKLILEFALYLANRLQPPKWKSGSPFINEQLRTIAEKR